MQTWETPGVLEALAENEARSRPAGRPAGLWLVRRKAERELRLVMNSARDFSVWAGAKGPAVPQAFEWLLDNRYLIERETRAALHTLRRAGKLPENRKTRRPVLFELASALVRATDGTVTLSNMALFLEGAQKPRALSERELSLFVPALTLSLCAHAARCCRELRHIFRAYRHKKPENPFSAELLVYNAHKEGAGVSEAVRALADKAAPLHNRLAVSMGHICSSLRLLSAADVSDLLQNASTVERTLAQDPAGVYNQMEERSRAYYRYTLSCLARKAGLSEPDAAKRALSLAQEAARAPSETTGAAASDPRAHVGYYILNEPLGRTASPAGGRRYFAALTLLSAAFPLAVWLLTRGWAETLLVVWPAMELAKNILDFITIRVTRPRHMPRMELAGGIPQKGASLCVVATLLTGVKQVQNAARLLEQYALANRDAGANLRFGLLADLPDAPVKRSKTDDTLLDAARRAVAALNRQYGGGFYLFFRERSYNRSDKLFMGWERKRGALLELARYLRGRPSGIQTPAGDESVLSGVRYLITLDADTRPTGGSIRELVGAMLHPLATPYVDPRRRVVTGGHALLQPRMAVSLSAAGATLFSRIYAGQGGFDPYNGVVSDVYQDVFGQGIFTGKGILEIDAYLACLDGRFPENRILSHDLLEGAYLRAGFIGDVEWSDGYPGRVDAWFARQHRWIRGDWQILSWLLPGVPGGLALSAAGRHAGRTVYEKNPLSAVSRYQIWDNARRSLTPFFLLLALGIGLWSGGTLYWASSLLAVICALSMLLLSAADLAARGGAGGGVRYHSTIITGLRGSFLQTFLQLLFLPLQAFCSLHAIGTSLYRMLISKRFLLRWVTADQTDQAGGRSSWREGVKAAASLAFWVPAMLWGLGCMLFGAGLAAYCAGGVWILAPLFAHKMSYPVDKSPRLRDADRAYLLRQASLIWQYFEDFLTPEDHFLPPDNWQEQPSAGLAHRTSPTNIGLALLCVQAALDLGLVAQEKALRLIDRCLTTIEKLPKWNGHIYNWYDTQTLEPLRPRCVSTVDSGNFAGYLLTLREGLAELQDAAAQDLSARAAALWENMTFEPLYDHKRRLFYIGYDLERDAPTDGYYDLLASEARQTSFLAVARGEIPRRHWKKLGRALSAQDRYRGMASWTGTMFEYFMPHLIMPLYENSLLYESAKFALYCQKKRGEETNTPWGVSESCFYAFDAALNYQYKAHGIPRLALKRGMGRELVVSPYSSYLALPLDPRGAVRNLRRLKAMGLEGRYGLVEAADFTPARQTVKHARFQPIRCFMAHHLGMSLTAIDNALRDHILQKRFMRDPAMAAFNELLMEKVPVGVKPLKRGGAEIPEKPRRALSSSLPRESGCEDIFDPRCHVLTNTSYSLFVTDTGLSASHCAGLSLTRFDERPLGGAPGFAFFLWDTGQGMDSVCSLTPAPLFDSAGCTTRCYMDGGCVRWDTRREDGLETSLSVRIPDNENAELRAVTLKNTAKIPKTVTLACYFEPVLAPLADYRGHPAFAKLFLESQTDGPVLLFKRRARGKRKEIYMALGCDHLAVRFESSREHAGSFPFLYTGQRQAAASPVPAGDGHPLTSAVRAGLDCCALAMVTLTLQPGQSLPVRFSLAVAAARDDAFNAAIRCLKAPAADGPGRLDGFMRLLGLSPAEAGEALALLPSLAFITPEHRLYAQPKAANTLPVRELWRFGVSGDLPILLYAETGRPEPLRKLIRQHRFLGLSGFQSDLVILTRDGGDYRRPARGAVLDVLKSVGGESALSVPGGVHLIEAASLTPADEGLFYACAGLVIRDDGPAAPAREKALPLARPKPSPPPHMPPVPFSYRHDKDNHLVFTGTPPTAWSHVLANGAFGALVTQAGPGHMWRLNARENKMTAWENDPLALPGREALCLRTDEHSFSLFSCRDGLPCTVTYGFGYAVWQKQAGALRTTVTAFVPPARMARLLMIEIEGAPDTDITLAHYLEPILGVDAGARGYIVTENAAGTLQARSSQAAAYNPQVFMQAVWPPFQGFTCDRASWAAGRLDGACGAGYDPCFGTVLIPGAQGTRRRALIVTGCAENAPGMRLLESLTSFDEAQSMLAQTKAYWRTLTRPFAVNTGRAVIDRYLDGWALYQVIACRLFARAALYQCGGAYGFRDQLQDVCAALFTRPALARTQILRACFHQFEEGDVQHWWHPARLPRGWGDKGVRTRITDDLLFLPYTVCEYLDKTGDRAILDIAVPYLVSEPLRDAEHDRFEQPRTGRKAGVYEHCVQALLQVMERGTGTHGLPLIGGGDWNDGFDRVGAQGRGESVWLGWFAAHVFLRFSAVTEKRGDDALTRRLRAFSDDCAHAADNAWDGGWYWRASYDDGTLLGSVRQEECRIDSIAQSFAFLAPGGSSPKREQALDYALRELTDETNRLIKLFDPPFDTGAQNPGYIKGYIPGVRENGGQYTHAAVWLAYACFLAGRRSDGERLLALLAPGGRDPAAYKVEPHVLAADVYSCPEHPGRGGWTHYTGAAAWYFRVACEEMLDIHGPPAKKDSREPESVV